MTARNYYLYKLAPATINWVNRMGNLVRLSVAMGGLLLATSPILTGTIFLELFNIKRKQFREGTGMFLLTLMFLAIGIAETILLRRC